MKEFLLVPPAQGKVTETLMDQLRAIPGMHVQRKLTYIVAAHFDGDEAQLKAALSEAAWTVHRGNNRRTYRVQ